MPSGTKLSQTMQMRGRKSGRSVPSLPVLTRGRARKEGTSFLAPIFDEQRIFSSSHCDVTSISLVLLFLCSSLAEIKAHIFLEKACEAVTWIDMRTTLKEIDLDFDKTMSLTEFFVFDRKLDWKALGACVPFLPSHNICTLFCPSMCLFVSSS